MSEPLAGRGPDPIEELGDLYENAPFGYLSMASDGRIFKVNATFARWMGCRSEDLTGRRLRDLLSVPSKIFYETNFAPLLRLQGRFEEVALDLITASGDKLPVFANAIERPGDDGQAPMTRVGLVRAVQRRGYERALQGRESEAVKGLSAERETAELREQFIAVLGHDLRNPLASIAGAARLLRREGQSEKALKILAMMETSVDRMAGLIDDVMDFARGRLGSGTDLNRTAVELEPVLRHVVEELQANHPSRDFICEFDLPVAVSVDPGRVSQLVSNLLGNALIHGDPKAPVRMGAFALAGRLQVWIANAGPAIPPEAMERLFQPFFRGEVRPSQQGLGLGLHIASEIARAHGGTITVASDEIETRFTLEAPLEAGDEAATEH